LRTSLTTVGRLRFAKVGKYGRKKRASMGGDALGETGLRQAGEGMSLIQKDYAVDGMRVILTPPHTN